MNIRMSLAAILVGVFMSVCASHAQAQLFVAYNATSATSFNTANLTDMAGVPTTPAISFPASIEFNGAWNNTTQTIIIRVRCYGSGVEPLGGALIGEIGLAPGELVNIGDPGIGISCPPGFQIAITVQVGSGAETVVGT